MTLCIHWPTRTVSVSAHVSEETVSSILEPSIYLYLSHSISLSLYLYISLYLDLP